MRWRGFSLIEMLVVLVIIGLLLALVVPNFVLFSERARRTAVRGTMHVVQSALEAYAIDNHGCYPTRDVSWTDTTGLSMLYWFPGGEPFSRRGEPVPGRMPVNPYTGRRYNSDSLDLDYRTLFGKLGPGQNALKRGDDPGCPFFGFGQVPDVAGGIGVATCTEATGSVEPLELDPAYEYSIHGYGRDATFPMYEMDAKGDSASDRRHWVFTILHN